VITEIKEKASRFSVVANRYAICWYTRSPRLLGTLAVYKEEAQLTGLYALKRTSLVTIGR